MVEGLKPEINSSRGVLQKRESVSKETGLRTIQTECDFGRGRVTVLQVMPQELTPEEQKTARKQIFIPGFLPSIRDDLPGLLEDLTTFAKTNSSEENSKESLINVGVAFTGKRRNSTRLVEGFSEGADITHVQFERAQDFIAATSELIDGNNAEIVGFSLGGTTALISAALGLKVDTVGLFNSTGLTRASKNHHIMRPVSQQPRSSQDYNIGGLSLPDRLKRLRAEHWSAYKSIAHPLLKDFPDLRFIVANSDKDKIYSKDKIRRILQESGAQNISFIDLPWNGHVLGGKRKPEQRKERIVEIVKVMHAQREKLYLEEVRKFHVMAEQAREQSRPFQALDFIDEAIAFCEKSSNKKLQAELLSSKSITYRHLYQNTGDIDNLIRAKDASTKAVELAKESADPTALAIPLFQLANVDEALGELPEAVEIYKQAVDTIINTPPGSHNRPAVVADFKVHLATCEYKAGDKTALERAESALQELKESEESDSYAKDVWVSGGYMRIAEMLKDVDPGKARESLQKAREVIDANSALTIRAKQWEKLVTTFEQND